MIKEFAEFKSEDKAIKVYFANGQDISGKIMEISPVFVIVDHGGVKTVIQCHNILYFHEAEKKPDEAGL
jgi:sRNA-binding regulator protein Hfq